MTNLVKSASLPVLNLPLFFKLALIEGLRWSQLKSSKGQIYLNRISKCIVICLIWSYVFESFRSKQVLKRAASSKLKSDADFSKLVNQFSLEKWHFAQFWGFLIDNTLISCKIRFRGWFYHPFNLEIVKKSGLWKWHFLQNKWPFMGI